MDKLIKSNYRVKNFGEFFTPKRIVKEMTSQPDIVKKINELSSTILEPSAGEGAFLLEILKKRINRTMDLSNNENEFNNNILLGLSTLYGVELLKDDHQILLDNMKNLFLSMYSEIIKNNKWKFNYKVIKSANLIIRSNIRQGDTLKRIDSDGNPIIFSEWKVLDDGMIQRIDLTFDDIVYERESTAFSQSSEQLDLFADGFNNDNKKETFKPVKFIDVYLEKINSVK